MNRPSLNPRRSTSGLSRGQRLIACCLLLLIVFMVVNPLCECHDQLDNLRHFGAHGLLVILLLVACAGTALTRALRSMDLESLGVLRMLPAALEAGQRVAHKLPRLLPYSLPLPLRV